MSKKNVHRKKKKWGGTSHDTHHIFYTKVSWNDPLPNKLRQHWYCIVDIPKDTLHHKIHEKVRYVPVPRNESIRVALDQLDLLEDYGAIRPDDDIVKRLQVFINIFSGLDKPTADALQKQLDAVYDFQWPSK